MVSIFSLGTLVSSSNNLIYQTFSPRNVAQTETQGYTTYTQYTWRGGVCSRNTGQPITSCTRSTLATGTNYRIRFLALKPFGNRNVASDYDIYYSPVFRLTT